MPGQESNKSKCLKKVIAVNAWDKKVILVNAWDKKVIAVNAGTIK